MGHKKRKRKQHEAPDEQGPPRQSEINCKFCLSEARYLITYAKDGNPLLDDSFPRSTHVCIYCLHLLQYMTNDAFHWAYITLTFTPRDAQAAIRDIEEMMLGRRDASGPERH